MGQDNVALARKIYDAWNARDFDFGPEHTTDDAVIEMMGAGHTFKGPDGSRQFAQAWAAAVPDGRVTIDRLIDGGERVVVEFTGRGTHTGPMVTPNGTIEPTGRSLELKFCDVLEFRDGRIVGQHSYLDSASMLAQMGLMPG